MAGEKRRSSFNTISKPTFKEKFAALGNLPRFFKLVWQTNHWYTILDAVLRLIRSAIPVSILYVGKLIIDEVVALSKNMQPIIHFYGNWLPQNLRWQLFLMHWQEQHY